MSWDLLAMKFPTGVRDLSELPLDFKDIPIGTKSDVSSALLTFPGARESGQGYINIETDGYAIEISVGDEAICTGLMFYVYGHGSRAVEVIRSISERLAIRTWDINGAQFLDDAADPASGFRQYKVYRDKVLKDAGADETT
jgi:hypothetical protein